jgi:hypothetical protein
MLARQPRDRYQTASELIIDLDRSGLAAALPSFADPDLARQDPWVQACLSTGEPTRLDPNASGTHHQRNGTADEVEWIVRYRNRAGRPCTTRITTDHILERLHEGTLPASAEARLPTDEAFQPLSAYAEFRDYLPPEEEPAPKLKHVAPPPSGRTTVLTLLGAAVVVIVAVVIVVIRWWPR